MSELLDRAGPSGLHVEPRQLPEDPHQESNGAKAAAFAAALTELSLAAQNGDLDPLAVLTEGAVDLVPGTEFSALVIPAGPGRLEARATRRGRTPRGGGAREPAG